MSAYFPFPPLVEVRSSSTAIPPLRHYLPPRPRAYFRRILRAGLPYHRIHLVVSSFCVFVNINNCVALPICFHFIPLQTEHTTRVVLTTFLLWPFSCAFLNHVVYQTRRLYHQHLQRGSTSSPPWREHGLSTLISNSVDMFLYLWFLRDMHLFGLVKMSRWWLFVTMFTLIYWNAILAYDYYVSRNWTRRQVRSYIGPSGYERFY